jgi:N-acetylmuramoyl-L-alanine amidase
MATKIYIDQGHNPVNPNAGAEGSGYREQDLVYEIGVLLSEILEENGFETRLSRTSPTQQIGISNLTSLQERVNGANSWGADYFISLHTNASANPSAGGSEALVYRNGTTAARLASSILEQLNLSTGIRSRGVTARPGLYVLRKTQMPAVLVELGFITNPAEAELMAESPRLFAGGIANGIIDFISDGDGEVFAETETAVGEFGEDYIFENESRPLVPEAGGENSYRSFLRENPSRGMLKIQASRASGAYPVTGLRIALVKKFDEGEHVFYSGLTDANGIIDGIELPAPPVENSLEYELPDKAASYLLRTFSPDYEDSERAVEIFGGIKTIQPLYMTLKTER